ncbi:MAG: metallophosphoesterase [Clostridiales bacterium]|nr:metallophosphoesterase [Clostridiales bacterium]
MKLLVFSDSHKNLTYMERVFDKIGRGMDAVVHLGDHYSDGEQLRARFEIERFYGVSGNCDYAPSAPAEDFFEFGGLKIFITHGHRYNVKSDEQRLCYAAAERGADVALFGHTHRAAVFREGGVLFMNPGSVSRGRDGANPSYGVVTVEGAKAEGAVIAIKDLQFVHNMLKY